MLNKFAVICGTAAFGLIIMLSTSAFAQTAASRQWLKAAPSNQAPLQRRAEAVNAERSRIQKRVAPAVKKGMAATAKRSVRIRANNSGTSQNSSLSEVISNGYRAYPASCLSDPLPDTTSGSVYSQAVDLAEVDPSTQTFIREGVTIAVWRVACVTVAGQNASATLMRIQRQAQYEGDATQYPLFPGVRMAQSSSGVDFDDPNALDFIRIAVEPNTVISSFYAEDPVVNSTTYVLEYFPDAAFNVQNYNNAFQLRFDNFFTTDHLVYSDIIPAYAPTNATYPAAFQPMLVSGYQSGNWIDNNPISNENMLIQVYELAPVANTPLKRALLFTWVAYDFKGVPLNLEGNAIYEVGATTVTSPLVLVGTGGVQTGVWGTVTFTFSDCNTSQFTYTNTSGLPGPSGHGTRIWNRLLGLNINGIVCQ